MDKHVLATSGIQEMLALKADHLISCVYHFYKRPPVIVRGNGCHLYDDMGREYLDCFSGVTVMNAGHANPSIIEPAIEQIRTLQHTTSIYITEPVLRLAQKLADITPGGLTRSFFTASGSEAVEGALLTSVLHTGKPGIIAMENGLHGRTRWAMNATGLPMWRTDPFPLDGVTHLPLGDLAALEELLEKDAGRFAALIAEPVQGNGGIIMPPDDYWSGVRALCTKHDVLLIFDEIQTGMGRTGKWFASEHWQVTPDIMTTSKALGNGFPIAAFITTDDIADSYRKPGASTYGGNPVSAIAALCTIEYHQEHQLAQAAANLGKKLMAGLQAIAANHPRFAPPRGLGLMVGLPVIDLDDEPDATTCDLYLEALKDHGILAGKTGPGRNVLTFLPPLVIQSEQIDQLTQTLQEVVQSCH